MGLVQRQSLKFSVINYLGTAIGILAVLKLYPHALAQYGLLRWLLDVGILLFPLISLGMPSLVFRLFPKFRDPASGHRGFLFLSFLWVSIGFSLFLLTFLLFEQPLRTFLTGSQKDSDLLANFFGWVVPIGFLSAIALLLHNYSINFKRTTAPTLLTDFLVKISVPILILGWLGGFWTERGLVIGLCIHYLFVIGGFIFYLKKIGEWKLNRNYSVVKTPEFIQTFGGNVAYGILLSIGTIAISKMDGVLVGAFIGVKSSAVYSIGAVIANVLEVPFRAIVAISTPLLAGFWAKNQLDGMRILYQKSSLNLLIVGLFLLGCIYLSIDDLFKLLPNSDELAAGKNVVLLLGLAKLIDMTTGLNNHVLIYSEKYFWHLAATILLGLANLGLSVWLIPKIGLTGAAVAVLASVAFYNFLTFLLVWRKFGLQPFSIKSLFAILLAITIFGLAWLIPSSNSLILNILAKCSLFGGLFAASVLFFKISTDLNEFWNKLKIGKLW